MSPELFQDLSVPEPWGEPAFSRPCGERGVGAGRRAVGGAGVAGGGVPPAREGAA